MIEVRGLTKRYGQFLALDQVSFAVHPGEIFAILGPNGSGKTTILKCIAGLTTPSAGAVWIEGSPINDHPRETRRRFSYLPQRVSFPESLTAREILEFYCRLRKLPVTAAMRVLRDANLDDFGDKPIREYSGGMVQRLGFSVALLPDAPLLLLDEPTAGLDPEVTREVRRALAGLRDQGRTVVLASHMLSEVEAVADRAGILVHGRLVAVESVLALRERVMQAAQLRLVLLRPAPELPAVALAAGASSAELGDHTLVVRCRAGHRLGILRALESAGARLESFSTEEPSLEEIYLRYVNESCDGNSSAAGHWVQSRGAAPGRN